MRRGLLALAVLAICFVGAVHGYSSDSSLQADGWAAPVALYSAAEWIADVSLATSADGTVHVVWDDGGQLFLAYGSPTVNSTPAAVAYGETPSLARGAGSAAHLAFVSLAGEQYDIYVSGWDGNGWALPSAILATEGDSFAPSVDWEGTLGGVAWAENTEGSAEIYLARSESGGPWLGGAVPNTAGDAPSLCLDAQGIHLAFQSRDPLTDKMDLWYTFHDGEGWSLPVAISDMPDADSSAGELACGGEQLHAAWQQEVDGGYSIFHAVGDASGWSVPASVSGGEDAFSPELADGADGRLHLVWAERHAIGYRLWAGDAWGEVDTFGPWAGEVLDVALDAAPDGTVHLAWVEMQGDGTTRVLYSWRAAPVTPTATFTPAPSLTPTTTPTATPTSTPTHRWFLPVIQRQSGF